MRKHSIGIWILLLSLSVAGIALLEASRCNQSIYIRLKLLDHGYSHYTIGENQVFVGTRQANCCERDFGLYNCGKPVYCRGKTIGCITKMGWFTPVGVDDGRKMLESERRFILTWTWFETFAFALGLISITALICDLAGDGCRRLPPFIFVSLVFLSSSCALSVVLGAYGIAVFKQAQWVPFNPEYGVSMLTIMSSFRVPSNGLLLFWNDCAWFVWSSLAVILIGTVMLYRYSTKWFPLLGAAFLAAVVFAGWGLWIWQSSMMNWYERWLL